jgi:hypothetical protein
LSAVFFAIFEEAVIVVFVYIVAVKLLNKIAIHLLKDDDNIKSLVDNVVACV